jgi:preprotein translocase subunit SecA
MNAINADENMAIESPMITSQIQKSQKKVETYHFDIRKHVLEYDDVMNMQREKFYSQRKRVLEGANLYEDILYMIECELDRLLKSYIAPGMDPSEYDKQDIETLVKELVSLAPQLSGKIEPKDILGLRYENVYEKIKELLTDAYREHEMQIVTFYNNILSQYDENFVPQVPFEADNVMRSMERDILLRVIDAQWIDHLHNIDMLRDGIGLRAYGQKDPLIEYKKEAYDLFNKMMYEIQSETVKHIFRSKFGIQIMNPETDESELHSSYNDEDVVVPESTINPNDWCPCGSGKKYKNCCGKKR